MNLYNARKAAKEKKQALIDREAEIAAAAAAEDNDGDENMDAESEWGTDSDSDEEAVKLDELLDGLEVDSSRNAEEEAGATAVLTADQAQKQVQFEYRSEKDSGFDEANYDADDFNFGTSSSPDATAKKGKKSKKGRMK